MPVLDALLAHFIIRRPSDGGTETIAGIIELHRRLARGHRNGENYRVRALLSCRGNGYGLAWGTRMSAGTRPARQSGKSKESAIMATTDDESTPRTQVPAYDDPLTRGSTTDKSVVEPRLLAERGLSHSAELLIDASFAAESSEMAVDEAREVADIHEIGYGAFVTQGDTLATPTEANALIEELQRSLSEKGEGGGLDNDLVDLWIQVEPWLDQEETANLWPKFIAMAPGEAADVRHSRGAHAQGGGH